MLAAPGTLPDKPRNTLHGYSGHGGVAVRPTSERSGSDIPFSKTSTLLGVYS